MALVPGLCYSGHSDPAISSHGIGGEIPGLLLLLPAPGLKRERGGRGGGSLLVCFAPGQFNQGSMHLINSWLSHIISKLIDKE